VVGTGAGPAVDADAGLVTLIRLTAPLAPIINVVAIAARTVRRSMFPPRTADVD
jgi:hypothetical protein